MSLTMRCNHCDTALTLDESQAGSIIKCPGCGQLIFVERSATKASPATDMTATPTESAPSGSEAIEEYSFFPPAQPSARGDELASKPPVAESPSGTMPWESPDRLSGERESAAFEFPDSSSAAEVPASDQAPAAASPALVVETPEWLRTKLSVESAPSRTEPPPQFEWQAPGEVASATSPPASLGMIDDALRPVSVGPSESTEPPPWAPDEDVDAAIQLNLDGPANPASSIEGEPDAPGPAATPQYESPAFGVPFDETLESRMRASGIYLDSPTPGANSLVAPAASSFLASSSTITPPAGFPVKFGILAASYLLGALMGFAVGRIYYGRIARTTPARSGMENMLDDGINRSSTRRWVAPTSAVPPAQLKKLTETIELPNLKVTALGVERRAVNKFRINPITNQRESEPSRDECLVLILRLQNTSAELEFHPLDEQFLWRHEERERPNYSFIEFAGEPARRIPMYDLVKNSEYNIEGEFFDSLTPGKVVETIVAAAEGSPAQAKGKLIWRLQLRVPVKPNGNYTTVVGFEFTSEQIRRG